MKVFSKIEDMLPNLRRLLSLDLRDDGRSEVIHILQTFTEVCQLPLQESEPHTQNQKILYNFGQWPVAAGRGGMYVYCFWSYWIVCSFSIIVV